MAKRTNRYRAPEPEYDMTLVGYARVSTEEQNLDMQVEALKRAGVHPDMIFTEKVSGASSKRPGRAFALRQCRAGMTFTVWRLDRVGRSLIDLLKFMQDLETAGINFRSLNDSIDTKTPAGKAMMHMLAVFAQFERDTIADRTRAGVKRAQERGIRFGQPAKVTPEVEAQMEKLIAEGEPISLIAKRFKVAVATVRLRFNGPRLRQIRERAARKSKRTR